MLSSRSDAYWNKRFVERERIKMEVAMQLLSMVFLLTSSLNVLIFALPAMIPSSQRGIIFPTVDKFDECFVDEYRQVKGTCKSLEQCPTALERWNNQNIRPQTCYFNKFDHIVCCEKEDRHTTPPETTTPFSMPLVELQRRSERQCERFYGPKISVVHGEPTKPKEFPFMAALGWRSNFNDIVLYRCGGALISSKFVLTAAHCVELGGESPHLVRLGGVNLTDPSVENISVKNVIVHPEYDATASYNDIALIELEKDAREQPVCVWSEEDVSHNNVTAIGYGHTRFAGISSDQLLKASLFLVANDICQDYYANDTDSLKNGVASTHICAGDPEKLRDTCQGDSGGPIVMTVERFYTRVTYVVGITSFGQGCAGGPPSIYTRTSSYIDWIEENVWPSTEFNIRKSKIRN